MNGPPRLEQVIASAARLQQVVPEAVLVGGSAAALYARHRESFDHDHVVADLAERYEQILEAVEATDGWVTSVRASRPPLTLMGSLGGIEAGLRQLRRRRPLEVTELQIPEAGALRVPTDAEMLRIKAYLIVQRNQVRDYLDVVALGAIVDRAASVLAGIDDYYDDRSEAGDSVLTALVQRLSEPNPRDEPVTHELASYKGLDPRWHDWQVVRTECAALADAIVVELG
ncbi:MAG: hypothetical protein J2O48_04975 [Solirubrobacterales bacterium]|nr:hypothetical protein [Solirubrobacterales bacterium]